MNIKIIRQRISKTELEAVAKDTFGDMVKGVADIRQKILALGGELHADAEEILLHEGSQQEDLWGFNIFVNKSQSDRIEYTSLINIRPRQNNFDREVKDLKLRETMKTIIDTLVE